MSDEEDEGEILMGRWDCGSCGQRGVKGDAYACSACGAPRPDDVEFYLPDEEQVVSDAAGIAAAEAGPDWQCAFCDSWMPATDGRCRNCDASQAESERRQRTGDVPERGPVEATSAAPPELASRSTASAGAVHSARPRRRVGGGLAWKPIAGVAGVLFLFLWLYGTHLANRRAEHDARIAAQQAIVDGEQAPLDAALSRLRQAESAVRQAEERLEQARVAVQAAERAVASIERELEATERQALPVKVTAHTWRVAIALEVCSSKDHQGWEHPRHAFDVRAEKKVHHTERVVDRVETRYRDERYKAQDGYDTKSYTERVKTGTRKVKVGTTTKNLGNGRFKRVPKYRTESVYKTVRKTKKVKRMVWRTRKVPYKETIYRQDPVYQDWYRYKTWVWGSAGSIERRGTGKTILDPQETPLADVSEAQDARRVARRTVTLGLDLARREGSTDLTVSRARWDAFSDGDSGLLVRDRLLTPSEHEARATRLRADLEAARAEVGSLAAQVPPLEGALPPLRAKLAPLRKAPAPLRQRVAEQQAILEDLKASRP